MSAVAKKVEPAPATAPVAAAPVVEPAPSWAPPPLPEFATTEIAHAHVEALKVEKLALEQYAAAAKEVGQHAGDSAEGHAARALGVQAEIDRISAEYPPTPVAPRSVNVETPAPVEVKVTP